MRVILYLDTILIPLSLFITIGYHAYLWHFFRHKPSVTTMGMNFIKRRLWLQELNQGDDKKGMLAVQSLRNALMGTIFTACITILVAICLAALSSATYNANHLLSSTLLGSQSGRMVVLKYGAATLFLLVSFWCSSMALASLIDANFLINALGEFSSSSSIGFTETMFARGFGLAVVGNRVLCITLPLLLSMFGTVAVALSSLALVWGLYELDFAGGVYKCYKKSISERSLCQMPCA